MTQRDIENQKDIATVDCPFCKKKECKVDVQRGLHFRSRICRSSGNIWCKELKYLLDDTEILLKADPEMIDQAFNELK